MIYNFDDVPERRGTDSVKWGQYEPDVLPLWVADMDFPIAEPIQQALERRVKHGVFGYPSVHEKPETVTDLKAVLIERMEQRYHWQVRAEEIMLLPGVITGLNLTAHAVATEGGNVVVQTPVYPPFLSVPANASLQRQDALLNCESDGCYAVDWEAFEGAMNDQTKLFILCNPHNPVGRVWGKDELERMAEICLRKGALICSDEIHCDLIYSGQRHIPIATLDKEVAKRTVTLMSPTKTFNIAGLQCSFAVVQDEELRMKLVQAQEGLVMWLNLIGLTAALAAYCEGQEWLSQVLQYLEGNRDYVDEYIRKELPQLKTSKPEGTYLTWIDCRESGIQGSPFVFFLKEARLAFNDGATFGRGGEGFVRMNLACTRQVLQETLGRMKAALERVH